MMRRLFFWLLLLAVFAGGFAYTMYNKPHKDYATEEVAKSWSADELVAWYTSHPAVDHAQWQEKVIAVTGEVSSADDRGVILAPGVVVTWETGAAPTLLPQDRSPSRVGWSVLTTCLVRFVWITRDSRLDILHDFLTHVLAVGSYLGVNFAPCSLCQTTARWPF